MNNMNCSKEACIAPICPADLKLYAQWFPDEDICTAHCYRQIRWIKTQKKLRRLLGGEHNDQERCFTLPMLKGIMRPRKGTQGIRPEDLYRNGTDPIHRKPSI